MALLNPLSGFQSMAASNHPLFPWNGQMIANSWDVQQLQQQKQQQQKEVESIQQKIAGMDWIGGGDDTSTSANSKSNRLQRRKVASIKHQGPVAHRHSNITVLPQFAYPILSNGTVIQLPILWTAMSLALGLEIRGEIIRGLPCIKRLNQLFCPTAGNRYPGDPIERFIDENKALIRRMYGEFVTPSPAGSGGGSNRRKRSAPSNQDSEFFMDPLEVDGTIFGDGGFIIQSENRIKRQADNAANEKDDTDKSDSCESTVEVVTPYWAANSSGKVRAIVNTEHFEQQVHQEVCSKTLTARCTGDCGCEQKYKWHRLLAYDPDNDCKGIFMDWFLFPSCCVCRCLPL